MSKWESAAPSTPLAWEDTCLVTDMTPGGTLAHIYQLTSTDQVSCALSSMLGAWDEKAKPLPSRLFHLIVKTGKASIRQLENKEALRTADEIGRRKKVSCVAESSSKSSWRSWHLSYSYSNLRVFGTTEKLAQSPRTKGDPLAIGCPILEGTP